MTQSSTGYSKRKSTLTKIVATILVIAVGMTFVMSILALIMAGI